MHLPQVNTLLKQELDLVQQYGHTFVVKQIRLLFAHLKANGQITDDLAVLSSLLHQQIYQNSNKAIYNLTGVVLHTNLGRALLSKEALTAIVQQNQHNNNLEFDLTTLKRGDRDNLVKKLICDLTGCEEATVVNNNAAAVFLVLNTLANKRKVVISRGQLIEIGGQFRIPDIMKSAGCKLLEVGATNCVHLKDYQTALQGKKVALLMKAHTSNYHISGFTKEVATVDLVQLAGEFNLPFYEDLGSGNLFDLSKYGIDEPTVASVLKSGVDLVSFSGDKLLGGPQCGIIAGKKHLIEQIKKNPLKRVLRVGKITLAALEATLKTYQMPELVAAKIPTIRHLTYAFADIYARALELQPIFQQFLPDYLVSVQECQSMIGSGASPVNTLKSCAIVITGDNLQKVVEILKNKPIAVLGSYQNKSLVLDLRCIDDMSGFIDNLRA
jgi:L-seryl-tRNA(Ser) seleniumtransferase